MRASGKRSPARGAPHAERPTRARAPRASSEGARRAYYLGPDGSFSHQAAIAAFGRAFELTPVSTIEEAVSRATEQGDDFAIVPAENSTEGGVSATTDALIAYRPRILAEIELPIRHALVGRSGGLSRVRKIASHPQALSQCRHWIAKHFPDAQIVPVASTSRAAELAARDRRLCAIASPFAAKLYGLEVLKRRTHDRTHNATRFWIISGTTGDLESVRHRRRAAKRKRPGRARTAVIFGLSHESGALRRALAPFERTKISLTRIESRPYGGRAWRYVFFCELEGKTTDANVVRCLALLERVTTFVHVFGSYARLG